MSVSAQLDVWLGAVELDSAGDVSAAIARVLAAKLDAVREDDSGAAAIAISGIAKELRAVITDIRNASGEQQEFIADLFA